MPSRPRQTFRLLLCLLVLSGSVRCTRDPIGEIRSLHEAGRYQDSLEPLEELLEGRPGDAELEYLYGIANLRSGRVSLALWPLRRARESDEWAVRAGEALAQAAFRANDSETAIEAATRVLEAQPDHRDMLRLRAEARLEMNKFAEALPDVERLHALDPDDEDAVAMRLRCVIGLERLDEAEALFAELEERSTHPDFPGPTNEHYCVAHMSFAKESGDAALAERRLEECLRAFPTGRTVLSVALGYFEEVKRPDRSIEVLRAALALEPSAPDVRQRLAELLRSGGHADQAEALLLEGTKLESEAALDAWMSLAAHYFQVEDYAASVSAWEELLKRVEEPETDLRFGYAEALLRAGHFDRAFEAAEKLPESQAGIIRALALLEQKKPAQALEQFDSALKLWPNHPEARYYAAIAAERAGDFDRAIGEYRQSLRSGAGNTDAGLRLAKLHEAEGAHEHALQALSKYREEHPDDIEGWLVGLQIAAELSRGERIRVDATSVPEESRAHFVAEAAEIVARYDTPDVAIDFLKSAPDVDFTSPRDAEALQALVSLLLATNRGRDARARADKALAAHPDTASFRAIHAQVLEREGAAAAQVRAEYARAIELDPNDAPALAALGRLDAEAGDAASARSHYARAAAADPSDADSRRRAADLAAAAGDLDEAQQRLETWLEDQPYDGRAAADLAALLVRRGADPEQVRSLARRAVRFGGGSEAYALLLETHLEAGQAGRAAAVLQAAARYRPPDASLRYQLGRALARDGQQDAARAAFEQALAAGDFPERSDAVTALASLPKHDG